jgi:hypothetical protein
MAMSLAGAVGAVQRCPEASPASTLFEQKYRASGHRLWRYCGRCPDPAP